MHDVVMRCQPGRPDCCVAYVPKASKTFASAGGYVPPLDQSMQVASCICTLTVYSTTDDTARAALAAAARDASNPASTPPSRPGLSSSGAPALAGGRIERLRLGECLSHGVALLAQATVRGRDAACTAVSCARRILCVALAHRNAEKRAIGIA